jgi:HSP90 family molecular chaperone
LKPRSDAAVLPGLGRSDEIGEMASAVEEFKIQAIARAEREDAAQDAQNKASTAQELIRFADEFESAVGSIVSNVSASAVQLEQAAGILTRTAETTQSLSSQVAGVGRSLHQHAVGRDSDGGAVHLGQ